MNLPPVFTTETVTKTVTELNSPYSEIGAGIMLGAVLLTLYVGIVHGAFPRPGGNL